MVGETSTSTEQQEAGNSEGGLNLNVAYLPKTEQLN